LKYPGGILTADARAHQDRSRNLICFVYP
jgi:hypothetical protein